MQEGSTGIQPPKGTTVARKPEAREPRKGKRKDSRQHRAEGRWRITFPQGQEKNQKSATQGARR